MRYALCCLCALVLLCGCGDKSSLDGAKLKPDDFRANRSIMTDEQKKMMADGMRRDAAKMGGVVNPPAAR